MLCIAVLILFFSPTLPVMEMTHSSNVFIQGSTINSAQGDIYINNTDSGMQDVSFIQKHPYR